MAGPVALAATASALVLAAIGAPLMAGSDPLAALELRSFFAHLCHQHAARSFAIDGSPVAVCVRCLGLYLGVALGAILAWRLRPPTSAALRIFFGALLLNGLDVTAETLHLHGNLPLLRFLIGASLGVAAGVLLCARTCRSEHFIDFIQE